MERRLSQASVLEMQKRDKTLILSQCCLNQRMYRLRMPNHSRVQSFPNNTKNVPCEQRLGVLELVTIPRKVSSPLQVNLVAPNKASSSDTVNSSTMTFEIKLRVALKAKKSARVRLSAQTTSPPVTLPLFCKPAHIFLFHDLAVESRKQRWLTDEPFPCLEKWSSLCTVRPAYNLVHHS